jgi:hypothetical protein
MGANEIKLLIKKYEDICSKIVNIIENSELSTKVIENLYRLQKDEINAAISMHPNATRQIIVDYIARNNFHGDGEEARIHAIYHPNLRDSDIWDVYSSDKSEEVREAALLSLARMYGKKKTIAASKLQSLYDELKSGIRGKKTIRSREAMKILVKHPKYSLLRK